MLCHSGSHSLFQRLESRCRGTPVFGSSELISNCATAGDVNSFAKSGVVVRWVPRVVEELHCSQSAQKNMLLVDVNYSVAKLDRFELHTYEMLSIQRPCIPQILTALCVRIDLFQNMTSLTSWTR